MTRGLGAIALAIVVVWLLAHLFYVGPVQDATEVGVLWVLGFATASLVGAAIILLVVAMALGQTRPAWLRFVRGARNADPGRAAALSRHGAARRDPLARDRARRAGRRRRRAPVAGADDPPSDRLTRVRTG